MSIAWIKGEPVREDRVGPRIRWALPERCTYWILGTPVGVELHWVKNRSWPHSTDLCPWCRHPDAEPAHPHYYCPAMMPGPVGNSGKPQLIRCVLGISEGAIGELYSFVAEEHGFDRLVIETWRLPGTRREQEVRLKRYTDASMAEFCFDVEPILRRAWQARDRSPACRETVGNLPEYPAN